MMTHRHRFFRNAESGARAPCIGRWWPEHTSGHSGEDVVVTLRHGAKPHTSPVLLRSVALGFCPRLPDDRFQARTTIRGDMEKGPERVELI
jgi:hypothetical protein